jgi:hypothetical protein
MRPFLLPALALSLVLLPAPPAYVAELPSGTVPTVAVPAANASFLTSATAMADKLLGSANGSLDLAKQAAALPFAGALAKGKVDAAAAQVDSATKLKSELTGLSQGHAAPAGGILAGLSSGTGPSLADRFKGLPLAGTVQTVLGNQELIKALAAGLPLDKVPGYTVAAQALSAFAPK